MGTERSRVTTLNNWLSLSPEYRAKIEDNQPFPIEVLVGNPGLDLEEDREKVEGVDDEDVPAERAKFQIEKLKLTISHTCV